MWDGRPARGSLLQTSRSLCPVAAQNVHLTCVPAGSRGSSGPHCVALGWWGVDGAPTSTLPLAGQGGQGRVVVVVIWGAAPTLSAV